MFRVNNGHHHFFKMTLNGEKAGKVKQLRLLIANRGEISLRIKKSASLFPRPEQAEIEFIPFVIYTKEEETSLFVQNVPQQQRVLLNGTGPRAYLNIQSIISLAKQNQIWGIIPGYGFLSESYEFARACEENGMVWCGPSIDQLRILSDKVSAKRLAQECKVPTLECTLGECASLDDIHAFANQLAETQRGGDKVKMMIKAVNGGAGRGMRVVENLQDRSTIEKSFNACAREAKAAFNDERLYAERFLSNARHIEVQIVGDGTGDVIHLWERECSLQRKHQKVIEIAPSPSLTESLRNQIIQASIKMAKKVSYKSLGTFEFLCLPESNEFFFMEVNPRIQVEHTITESITGKDLVAVQLLIALGKTLKQIGLRQDQINFPFNSTSIQLRINAEKFQSDGNVIPTGGTLKRFNLPFGPNVRVDTNAHSPLSNRQKYQQTPLFDSLLAKIIITSPTYTLAIQSAKQAIHSTIIEGFETNLHFVQALLENEQIRTNKGVHTRFIEEHFQTLLQRAQSIAKSRIVIENEDQSTNNQSQDTPTTIPEGMKSVQSPLSGLVVEVMVKPEERVQKGQEIAILESMKMEHVIRSNIQGTVKEVLVNKGGSINESEHIVFIESDDKHDDNANDGDAIGQQKEDPDQLRPDLEELIQTRQLQSDQQKQASVKRRHGQGYLTARENIARFCDPGTFIEYGDLMVAAQRTRTDEEELREKTMNDGVITGWATVNGKQLGNSAEARCGLCIYDYMVLAGTQGFFHHLKLDRLFRSILENPAPVILYAEGGGGRPGDVDLVNIKVGGLDTPSFALLAAIRARGYPTVGLANGYTFAGNAALLGTCDIVVATEGGSKDVDKPGITSTGMGGPAMIEGGGLGKVAPQDVGRTDIHFNNGDYDIVVPTEKEASEVIKKVVSFFQGSIDKSHWTYSKQEKELRTCLPKQRTRAYEVRNVIELLSDDGSFIELGKGWGHSLVTGLARFAGQPVGILASSVLSPLGGAIDVQSARKATRLIQLLHRTNASHLLVLCDTPGFMVGTPAEKEGGLRAFADFFAAITQFQDGQNGGRIFAVTIRKAYGLGAQALLGGSSISNFFSVAWPQGEFAAMGIEGAVRLGMRKELEAAEEGQERDDLFKSLVDMMYQRGKAQNMAAMAEIDTVIDPAETRKWLLNGLLFTRPRIPTWKTDSHKHSSHL